MPPMTGFSFRAILPVAPIAAVVGTIVFLLEVSHSAERDWRATHKNQFGEACCDDTDCSVIQTDEALRLRVGDLARAKEYVLTPVNKIYPTQDGKSYFCTTGCLFRPLLN